MKRKVLRNFVLLIALLPIGVFAYGWFDMNYMTDINSAEVDEYYELLLKHSKPAEGLTLSTGIEKKEDLPAALERLQKIMGLGKYDIDMDYGDQDEPPAYVQNTDNKYMTIIFSNKVRELKELLSTLVHELSHVSVWQIDPSLLFMEGLKKAPEKSIFKGCDLEKVVDVSGVLQGQGVLTLNGQTDDFLIIPGLEFTSIKKSFGYLKPEEYGYLLARYCHDHGIPPANVEPYLDPGVRKYFIMGKNYLDRTPLKNQKPSGAATGIYWCPKCGNKITVDLSGTPPEIKCGKCSFHLKR